MLKQLMHFPWRSGRWSAQTFLWTIVCSALVGVMIMTLVPPASAQSQQLKKNLAGALKGSDPKSYKVPVFKKELSTADKLKAVKQMDLSLKKDVQRQIKAKGPQPRIQHAVRVWESLSTEQKVSALSGEQPPAIIPTWAVAAVGAAALAYEVGKDYSYWGAKSLNTRSINDAELDYIKSLGQESAYAREGLRKRWMQPGKVYSTDLDY